MKKILLVYDEYNEIVQTETQLKKVGLDVVGISNELSLSDQILSFNPDLVIASGQSNRVSSFSVAKKVAQSRIFHGRVMIIAPKGVRPKPDELIKMKMDALVEAPVTIERLLSVLAKILGLEYTSLLEKLQRVQAQEVERQQGSRPDLRGSQKAEYVKGGTTQNEAPEAGRNPAAAGGSNGSNSSSSAVTNSKPPADRYRDTKRMAKYADFLASEEPIDPKETSFQRDEVRDRLKEMKKDWDLDELDEQDKLKRDFANAMFRKK